MAKRQDRQYNGQKTGQTIQWPKDRRTDNTMAKRQKDRQYNGQKTEGQTIQWPKDRRHVLVSYLKGTLNKIYLFNCWQASL
jgi:hypothetical protein